jgi:ABC-type multidrug transport system fused ATPase/permease subunit
VDTLKQLAVLLTPHERAFALGLTLLALLAALAEALGIAAVFPLLNLLTKPELMFANPRVLAVYEWTGARSHEQFVLLAACVLLLLFVMKNLVLIVIYYAQARFVCDADARIGTDLLTAYLCSPYVERAEQNSADRIRVITGEVNRVTAGFLMQLVNLVAEGLVVFALLALLLVVQPRAAVLTILLMGTVGVVVQLAFRKKLNEERHLRVEATSAMFRTVSEGLGSLKETKVMHREPYFVSRFSRNTRRYADSTVTFMTINLAPRLLVETAAVAALTGTIALAIMTGQALDTIIPTLTLFGLAAVRIMPSATRILSATNTMRYYTTSVREVSAQVVAARQLPRERADAPTVPVEAIDVIEAHGVSYSYPGAAAPTLRDVTLRVARGEIVALTGRSGSGKTTLADILLGLLVPTTGEIRANGRVVGDPRKELGAFAGLVPQNFFILDDTVRRNIAFGVPDEEIVDARVWNALELARMAERVRSDSLGLDMPVGENGALLSGGERQRLSIARALYHDPGLLVFDEATSALDDVTEAEVVRTIRSLAQTKAVLVIAHRRALLDAADHVFLVEDATLTRVADFETLPAPDSNSPGTPASQIKAQ